MRNRLLLKLTVFVLAGAIVNVAVAWGCVCRMHRQDPLAVFADKSNVLVVCYEGPLSTVSRDFGLTSTWRTSQAMGVTWGCPTKLVDEAEFDRALPYWSALRGGTSPRRACEEYALQLGPLQLGPVIEAFGHCDIVEFGAGWPMVSFRAAEASAWPDSAKTGFLELPLKKANGWDNIEVPCKPIIPGFAVNTAVYASMLWLLFAAPRKLRRIFRGIRRRRGRCVKCAYDLRAIKSSNCPECGTAITT